MVHGDGANSLKSSRTLLPDHVASPQRSGPSGFVKMAVSGTVVVAAQLGCSSST